MARPDMADLAERATLGALLVDPAPLAQIRRWLRPGDFVDPWHGQVFTTLLERHAAGQPIDAITVWDAMTERLGARLADAPRLHQLISATPQVAGAGEYARLVLDGGLRREIAGLGVLLQASALQAANNQAASPLTATCGLVEAGLDAAAVRWSSATGATHDGVVVPLAFRAATRDLLHARLGAAKYLDAHPPRDWAAERQRQVDLVGTLIAHPQHIPEVAGWLPGDRIADPGWRRVYRTACDLAASGQSVDLVTVTWAAHRRAGHGRPLPGPDELRDVVEAGWYAYPPHAIRAVAADQARDLADTGARHLHRAAASPAVSVPEMVEVGRELTVELRRTATGLPSGSAAPVLAPAVTVERTEAIAR